MNQGHSKLSVEVWKATDNQRKKDKLGLEINQLKKLQPK
jgi:hypothetical protein